MLMIVSFLFATLWNDVCISSQTYAMVYNSQREVEDANKVLQTRWNEFCSVFSGIRDFVMGADVPLSVEERHKVFGIGLAHNHFQVGSNQIMRQVYAPTFGEEQTPALVTQPQEASCLEDGMMSASWIPGPDGKPIPFEFSNDPAVQRINAQLKAHQGFLEGVMQRIHASGLPLSFMILARDTLSREDGKVYLEKNGANASVVRLTLKDDAILLKTIATSWTLEERIPTKQNAGCFCWSIWDDFRGTHVHTGRHRKLSN